MQSYSLFYLLPYLTALLYRVPLTICAGGDVHCVLVLLSHMPSAGLHVTRPPDVKVHSVARCKSSAPLLAVVEHSTVAVCPPQFIYSFPRSCHRRISQDMNKSWTDGSSSGNSVRCFLEWLHQMPQDLYIPENV